MPLPQAKKVRSRVVILLTSRPEVRSWKFNHNVFGNREEAAEAKALQESRDARMEMDCAPGGSWSVRYPFLDMCKRYRERKAKEAAEKQEREQKQGDAGTGDE